MPLEASARSAKARGLAAVWLVNQAHGRILGQMFVEQLARIVA